MKKLDYNFSLFFIQEYGGQYGSIAAKASQAEMPLNYLEQVATFPIPF